MVAQAGRQGFHHDRAIRIHLNRWVGGGKNALANGWFEAVFIVVTHPISLTTTILLTEVIRLGGLRRIMLLKIRDRLLTSLNHAI